MFWYGFNKGTLGVPLSTISTYLNQFYVAGKGLIMCELGDSDNSTITTSYTAVTNTYGSLGFTWSALGISNNNPMVNGVTTLIPGYYCNTFSTAENVSSVNFLTGSFPLLNYIDIGGYSSNRRIDLNMYPPTIAGM